MVTAIVNLARSLGLTVVVEGTETEEQIAWLAALGQIEAQGFLFSRPVPSDGIPALLDKFGVCGLRTRALPRERSDGDTSDAPSTSGQPV
jgi:predicted signal transduction protein with EAL and GGDEF domain